MERVLTQLVERLHKTYQDRLVSVVLYGSAAVGDHHGRFSDINVLCVLTEVTPSELGDSAAVFRWWREKGNPAPLLLSAEEVRTSTDCFPIEFLDIRERHRVLFGEDIVENIDISTRLYRGQVEHELRATLLRLRQKAAGVLGEHDLLLELMTGSLSTFCVLLRHSLKLHGVEASLEKRAVVEQAAGRFTFEPVAFRTLLDLREGKIKARDIQPGKLFESYLKEIQVIIEAVDRLEK
jgi:predicted nucleotidyltransferase